MNLEMDDDRPLDLKTLYHSERWHTRALKTPCEMARVLEDLLDQLRAADFTAEERFTIRVAMEEAIVNAVRHGHNGDLTKTVLVRLLVDDNFFLAQVEDEGSGFAHQELMRKPQEPILPAIGRGIHLMRFYMNSVTFNRTGNCVTLYKHRAKE